jgi:hypothetical protein
MKSFLHLFQKSAQREAICNIATGTKARGELDQRDGGVREIETRTETREQDAQATGFLMSAFRLL